MPVTVLLCSINFAAVSNNIATVSSILAVMSRKADFRSFMFLLVRAI